MPETDRNNPHRKHGFSKGDEGDFFTALELAWSELKATSRPDQVHGVGIVANVAPFMALVSEYLILRCAVYTPVSEGETVGDSLEKAISKAEEDARVRRDPVCDDHPLEAELLKTAYDHAATKLRRLFANSLERPRNSLRG